MTDTIQERARELAEDILHKAHHFGGYDNSFRYTPSKAAEIIEQALKAERKQAEEEMKEKAASCLDPDELGEQLCSHWREAIRNLPLSGHE